MSHIFPLSNFEGKLISNANLKHFSIDSRLIFEDFQDYESGRINLQIGHITRSGRSKLQIYFGKTERRLNITLSAASLDLKFGKECSGNYNILAYADTFINFGDCVTSNETKIVLDSGSSVNIGSDCMFSNGCQICAGDMHEIFDIENLTSINSAKNVIDIGDHVWISRGASIVSSSNKISLGHGSIVGMNSVVTKDVNPMTLVAGVPAKILKQNVSWTRSRYPNKTEKQSIVDGLNKHIHKPC